MGSVDRLTRERAGAPFPSHSKNISLFYRKEDPERVVLEDGYSSFLSIPCVGISNCRCGNSIRR